MIARLTWWSLLLLWPCQLAAAEFPGWQGIRVVEQDGYPTVMRADDVDQDGRQELIVVNTRYSRLDVYDWVPGDSRGEEEQFDDDRPNDLPMTREVKRMEVQLEQLPVDVLVKDINGDGRSELVILVAPPNRVLVYSRGEADEWKQDFRIDLLAGDIPTRRRAMLLREAVDGESEVLVSLSDGIQRARLHREGRASWLTPREKRDRADWWLADLDGDGDEDLVEQSRAATESIRWYPCSDEGELMPAQVLFDRATSGAEVLRVDDSAEVVLLDSAAQGLIRRYRVGAGEASRLGERHALPLIGGKTSVWCGMKQGEARTLIVADPDRPRLLSYELAEHGWHTEQDYPGVANVQAMAAPVASPDTLLIWTKDAADLQKSRWNSERLTYPEAWPQSPESDDRRILALAQVGQTTWWVQRVGSHVDLYRWRAPTEGGSGQEEPSRLRFEDVGSKVDQVLWIGGDRLLVKDALARGLRLAVVADGKTTISSPSHLDRASVTEFKLLAVEDEFRLGRLTDGVLQWLGDDLHPHDQIMLPEGLEMADYVAVDDASGWALQTGSPYVHWLEADDSGIMHASERIKVSSGTSLVQDAILGLFLVHHDRVTLLEEGTPRELELVDVIDERIGRAGGVRETRFHRIATADVNGDGCDELLLFDDMDHRLSVLACLAGELEPQIAWPVFDDKIYPYDSEMTNLVQEPRAVCGLDFDGDDQRDLALLCHDRLLIYLGREEL